MCGVVVVRDAEKKMRPLNKGSFLSRFCCSMVLSANQLKADFDITSEDIFYMRNTSKLFSFVDEKRRARYGSKCKMRSEEVEKAETCHYETLAYKQALLDGDHRGVEAYLNKVNESGVSLTGTKRHAKRDFVERRKALYRDHQERKRQKRDQNGREANARLGIIRNGDGMSLYDVLEIKDDAGDDEVKCAYRRLARKYHPDKRKVSLPVALWWNKVNYIANRVFRFVLIADGCRRNDETNQRSIFCAVVSR